MFESALTLGLGESLTDGRANVVGYYYFFQGKREPHGILTI